eukprot:gnl/TRDRNA2_/TRDRNA2_175715_c0_seq8.p1 gnl/TRDRNA2_/TRDRNA2_175715_c0~~gnl/TRDRNA2_/TRDRNA2_175715_c0_seq8.p1  ORF type:complete len:347 (-),score=140.28 gnl/TRDRNA2_/TRDRNA2_175715_c0_seq8:92-1132(-)
MQAMMALLLLALLGCAQASNMSKDPDGKYPEFPADKTIDGKPADVPDENWYPDVYDKQNIDPDLHPQSDEKHFDDDYPSDERPAVVAKFSHPYPAVQDSSDYDKDYVKDENDDGGEWSAQMDYDSWKNKYGKMLRDLEELRAKEREERLEWEAAAKKEEEAEAVARKLEEKWANAWKDHDMDVSVKDAGKWNIRPAIKKVEEETDDLEECKKELAEARKELARLQAEEAKAKAFRDEKVAELKKREEEQIAAEKEEARLEKVVAEEQKEYEQAKATYDKENAEFQKTAEQLAEAEEKLRRFRNKVDDKGGIYRMKDPKPPAKAFARGSAAVSALALIVAICSVFAN